MFDWAQSRILVCGIPFFFFLQCRFIIKDLGIETRNQIDCIHCSFGVILVGKVATSRTPAMMHIVESMVFCKRTKGLLLDRLKAGFLHMQVRLSSRNAKS